MRARRQCKEPSELPCNLSCRSPTPLGALRCGTHLALGGVKHLRVCEAPALRLSPESSRLGVRVYLGHGGPLQN